MSTPTSVERGSYKPAGSYSTACPIVDDAKRQRYQKSCASSSTFLVLVIFLFWPFLCHPLAACNGCRYRQQNPDLSEQNIDELKQNDLSPSFSYNCACWFSFFFSRPATMLCKHCKLLRSREGNSYFRHNGKNYQLGFGNALGPIRLWTKNNLCFLNEKGSPYEHWQFLTSRVEFTLLVVHFA